MADLDDIGDAEQEYNETDIMKDVIVLSAGGTGGHVFPAEALAQELRARGYRIVIITDKRGYAFGRLGDDVPVHCVRAATLKSGIRGKVRAAVQMGIGILHAAILLLKYRPVVIVGFGGYPSFPAVFAGQLLGMSTVLHEQNAVLGRANAVLARRAKAIATSLPDTIGIGEKDKAKVTLTGNPVRSEIIGVRDVTYEAPVDKIKILITGGSQASDVFARVVPSAVMHLPEGLRRRLFIMHQARAASMAETELKYKEAGVWAEVKPFFTDMPARLKACHLFIGRAGASTVCEIAVTGRPAIFVPYPGHGDEQQKHNANTIAAKGGAWMMTEDVFTPEKLAETLTELIKEPLMLKQVADIARTCGKPDAVHHLAKLVERRIKT